jgi:hypothetical protein
MIRTLITPDNQDLSIHIPADYVGRPVEVLLYALDELDQSNSPGKKKPSDFKGKLNLTEEQYQDFQQHLKDIRNEWERDI